MEENNICYNHRKEMHLLADWMDMLCCQEFTTTLEEYSVCEENLVKMFCQVSLI